MHAAPFAPVSAFGNALRRYRHGAGRSQLHTALSAGVSQRHLSFLESGRARPSRGMVIALGASLGLSLAEQNDLLLAAGYAPVFRPDGSDPQEQAMMECALHAFLRTHEPYPALLLRDGVRIEKGNGGALRLWSALCGGPATRITCGSLFEFVLGHGAFAGRLENGSETVAGLLRRHIAEQALSGQQPSGEALAVLARHPEVKRLLHDDPEALPPPVLQIRYRFDDTRLRLLVVVVSLRAPLDTRPEALRVAVFMPADEATADWFRDD